MFDQLRISGVECAGWVWGIAHQSNDLDVRGPSCRQGILHGGDVFQSVGGIGTEEDGDAWVGEQIMQGIVAMFTANWKIGDTVSGLESVSGACGTMILAGDGSVGVGDVQFAEEHAYSMLKARAFHEEGHEAVAESLGQSRS